MTIFRDWLPVLFGEGGFLRERSSHYQLIVLNWVLDSWKFLAAAPGNPDDVAFLREQSARMLAAAANICDRDGNLLTLVGDVSPDLTPEMSAFRIRALYPDLWPLDRLASAHMLVDGWFKLVAGDDIIVGNFPAGNYPPEHPTHGHNDITSFAWLHGGRGILVDPGRYRYTPDATSLFQRSAAAHNVVLVNGLSPVAETLVASGAWWPLPYGRARLEVAADAGGVVLTHDGFARATPVARHRRRIVPGAARLDVIDEFEGAGAAELAACWHFGASFERFDEARCVAVGPRARVAITCEGLPSPPTIGPAAGAAPGGWISRRYGERHPSLCLRFNWSVELPVTVKTRFVLDRHE
jgi:hypothetical protein